MITAAPPSANERRFCGFKGIKNVNWLAELGRQPNGDSFAVTGSQYPPQGTTTRRCAMTLLFLFLFVDKFRDEDLD
jgi:hypothetical protein